MAKYDYVCLNEKCRKVFEKEFSFSENPDKNVKCPSCNTKKVKRVLNKVSVHYTGNGFYSTDNKKAS